VLALTDVASSLAGFDQLFLNRETTQTSEGFTLYGNYESLPEKSFDVITALAVFEHIEPSELPSVLNHLKKSLKEGGCIVGTLPTPLGRPVLEFLSYKLKLIDESQIRDHKIYYDQNGLRQQLKLAGYDLQEYYTFQFGMNSFFVATPNAFKQP
jgi:SAM-dependent methyltransferase